MAGFVPVLNLSPKSNKYWWDGYKKNVINKNQQTSKKVSPIIWEIKT